MKDETMANRSRLGKDQQLPSVSGRKKLERTRAAATEVAQWARCSRARTNERPSIQVDFSRVLLDLSNKPKDGPSFDDFFPNET
jgi:hypothetical protein